MLIYSIFLILNLIIKPFKSIILDHRFKVKVSKGIYCMNSIGTLSSCAQGLLSLNLQNINIRSLPIDKNIKNFCRQVPNAIFSLVNPDPVLNPKLISISDSAVELLGLNRNSVSSSDVELYLSGNALLPGSQPVSHCYCGHQFGSFAGQLGDGAAILLGEIQTEKGEFWEIQLKGAGLTPYSRSADGRKVLRSSVREFLCSEAMHFLNIPTTRALACVTSDTTVQRDPMYDGTVIDERCTVVTRIAPNFFRFGSFEIFKKGDVGSGERSGMHL